MKYPLRRFLPTLLLTFLLAMPVAYCMAQQTDPKGDTSIEIVAPPTISDDEHEEEEDTGNVLTDIDPYSRVISADTIAAYKKNASFGYMAYLDSMLRADEKARQAQPPPKEVMIEDSPSVWDLGIVKLLCYLVAIGLVGFVIYKLFIGQGLFFRNKKSTSAVPAVELDEVINESDLEKALRTAISKKDYRLGVRYLFLMTLQRLGDRGALQLSTDKTNYQYATELSGKSYAVRFAQLSLQYEYVWFGNFNISESQFSALQQQHQQFLKEI